MRPITSRRHDAPAARRAWPALLLAVLVLLAAGCSAGGQAAAEGSSSPVPATSGAATPAIPSPSSTPAASSIGGSASSAPVPTPSTAPTLVAPTGSFASPYYGYGLVLSTGWTWRPALEAWDGSARVDSDGPYVDRALGPGSKLFFVYGAPTYLDPAGWSAKGQADVSAWHGCPATPETSVDVTIGAAPGRLHGFHCQGLWVMKAFVVRNGFGSVFNQIGPPGAEEADMEAFTALLSEVAWAR